jgi:hypothetical protein
LTSPPAPSSSSPAAASIQRWVVAADAASIAMPLGWPGRGVEDAGERGAVRRQDLQPAHDDLEQPVVGVAVDGLVL